MSARIVWQGRVNNYGLEARVVASTEVDTCPDSKWCRIDIEDASTDALGVISWRRVDDEFRQAEILEEVVKALVLAEVKK